MLSRHTRAGTRQILGFALPVDFIGFQPNLSGPMKYSAHAVTDVRVCAFPRTNLQEMMNSSSKLASRMAILKANDIELTEQLLIANSQTVNQQVASLLLYLFLRVQALNPLIAGSTEDSIEFPLSQILLADALNSSPETINRALRSLREEKVLELKAKKLFIIDKAKAFEQAELAAAFSEHQALL